MPEKTAKKQGASKFPKGKSGNPAGRPKGSRNKATVAAEVLLDGETDQLTRKAIDLALEGDTTALRLCLERILPPRKSRPVSIDLPALESVADVLKALSSIVQAVGGGELTPEEGQSVAALLEQARKMHELVDLDERVRKLEDRVNT